MLITIILTVPSGPPQSTDTQALSSTSLLLTWSEPLPDQQNGPIVGYLVRLVVVGSTDTTDFTVSSTTLEVESLTPYTFYEWRVAAQTSAGTGLFSTPLTEQTLPDGMCCSPTFCELSFCTMSTQLQMMHLKM